MPETCDNKKVDRFSLILQKILAFASSAILLREVKNLPLDSKELHDYVLGYR